MIIQIAMLFILFEISKWLSETLHLMIPGSVIGLVLLFLLLVSGLLEETYIKEGATFMTKHLVLFFIPALVGIVNYVDLFKGKGMLLIVITIVSTVLVMAVSGFVSQWVHQRNAKASERGERDNA